MHCRHSHQYQGWWDMVGWLYCTFLSCIYYLAFTTTLQLSDQIHHGAFGAHCFEKDVTHINDTSCSISVIGQIKLETHYNQPSKGLPPTFFSGIQLYSFGANAKVIQCESNSSTTMLGVSTETVNLSSSPNGYTMGLMQCRRYIPILEISFHSTAMPLTRPVDASVWVSIPWNQQPYNQQGSVFRNQTRVTFHTVSTSSAFFFTTVKLLCGKSFFRRWQSSCRYLRYKLKVGTNFSNHIYGANVPSQSNRLHCKNDEAWLFDAMFSPENSICIADFFIHVEE